MPDKSLNFLNICRLIIPFGFIISVFFSQCKKNETLPPQNLKKEYFPLKLSSVITYDVDSTVYDDFTNQVTAYKFELKDTVIAVFSDGPDRNTIRIERYKRIPGGGFNFQKVFTRTLIDLRAEEFIDNQRFVSMIFPPEENKTWNGNTYNNLGKQEFRFLETDIALNINSINFDSTATILQKQENNLIREDLVTEVYAKNTGLVKKEIRALDKNINTGVILKGYTFLMQVKSFN